MWRLWKSRNEFLFQQIDRFPWKVAQKGEQEATEWVETTINDTANSHSTEQPNDRPSGRSKEWSPPPEGYLKCNFDSGYVQGRDYTSTCWIIRDSNGHVIHSGCAKLQQSYSALQAEALGFLHALQMVWIRGYRYVWFEGEN
ncbi:non-LTR retroelement reverse transcriptase [Arabidopsis thaliana]|uniref:Non-LTR retroelement reverse transcriptase n=1 Tax=Arabidopsis thaliana TaxID=3702 RepID=F4JKS9_ARATH|nr:non-LTR retroelement reverse transcriptase [Arabidopsis thaliana]AEE82796.1 non-LTR retroelement reverse transcriptase [Arabidopsis thaliana]|eukprot:NP_680673.1 non-LTR retroelement reverse transcriptase [Arabidopsis thaliana]